MTGATVYNFCFCFGIYVYFNKITEAILFLYLRRIDLVFFGIYYLFWKRKKEGEMSKYLQILNKLNHINKLKGVKADLSNI